ncbi:MAG: Gfo/Idh/MocA family oxidoreductase [Lentisphaeria bacterium]|nr:Gfo/Idh/MocA family oxidoreductase [Lentisphaeria bacterium]
MIGTGGMARHHLSVMLGMKNTKLVGYVEPSLDQQEATQKLHETKKVPCPPFYGSIKELIKAQGPADAAFIITPHKFHLKNTSDCLKAGMDVLLEKPMVLNETEAKKLIKLREKTGKLLVIGFPGSLSPAIKKAKQIINSGKLGNVSSISAYVHQHWKHATIGTWRQNPEISGGGFLFDTGSHMINTVVDLGQDDVVEVSAIMDNCATPVEINSTVSGRFASGTMFSLAAAGDSMHCTSMVTVMGDRGVLQTGIWGERLLFKSHKDAEFTEVKTAKSQGVWEQFIKVRSGKVENPCPPEVGLRFARLMDMIRKSADTGKTIKRTRKSRSK